MSMIGIKIANDLKVFIIRKTVKKRRRIMPRMKGKCGEEVSIVSNVKLPLSMLLSNVLHCSEKSDEEEDVAVCLKRVVGGGDF